MFTDIFLYGIIIPILPPVLVERVIRPEKRAKMANGAPGLF